MAQPTSASVLAAIILFNKIGEKAFIEEFATGHFPREFYLRHNGVSVPLKALWAASHVPPIKTRPFTTDKAKAGFLSLGFDDWGPYKDPSDEDALHDISSDLVDTRLSTHKTYVRNREVRAAVMRRAAGNCEFCGDEGFAGINGVPYLESHHIVHLAHEGKDKRTNVIALCPNHHRAAHFAVNRAELEHEMAAIVAAKESAPKNSN